MSAINILKENVEIEKISNQNQRDTIVSKIEEKGKMSKALVAAAVLTMGSSLFAADNNYQSWASTDDSFGDLLGTFIQWLTGNLGKTIALLGFIGTFIIYLFTHKGSVLFIGILISLIAGGLVGIVATFFNFGASAFAIHENNET